MSVGSWILGVEGGLVTLAAAHEFLDWFPRPLARLAEALAALLGMPLATYTAALIANTAVPVWHEGQRELPFAFAGGSAMAAGAAAAIATPGGAGGPARRLVIVGAVTEIAAVELMKRRLGELGAVYEQGTAGTLERLTLAAAAGGGAAMVVAEVRERRRLGVAACAAALSASLLGRWMVFRAGFQSAAEPEHTVGPQRARVGH
jgi:DMSO reductase anchor subunit